MASNHKLTGVIAGRTISGTGNSNDTLTIHFTDKSTMSVKTSGSSNSASTGGAIKEVLQQGTTLTLEFDGGSTLDIPLAEATSSVIVRGADDALQYAD